MKINKVLVAFFAMTAVVLSSCKDDDPTVGIDSNMPAPAIYYDAQNSMSTTIAVYWDARQAVSAGATSFTVQLIKTPDGTADVYDTSVSKTVPAYDKDGQINEQIKFDNLTKGRIFYVRLRANYPRSVFSDWKLAARSESDPTEARIMIGQGVVDDTQEETTFLKGKFVQASESTAIVTWSTCDWAEGGEAVDAAFDYTIELYKDADCKDLDVSWKIAANTIDLKKYGPRFIFSGLTPKTDYYFRVTNTTDNVVSDPVKVTTTESHFKELPETAAVGDIILFQDFHELLWGGDLSHKAAGYSNNGRSKATVIDKATGENPVSAEKYYLVSASTEMGLFNTLGKAIPSTSLKDWGQQSEEKNTSKPGILLGRPGMLKMGASSFRGAIVTPELKCLTQPATIELTFKTAAYDDGEGVDIELLDGTTKEDENSWIKAKTQTVIQSVNAGSTDGGWTTHTVTVPNVTSTSRIAIGSTARGEGAAQHRFYLDDISIKVIAYGELAAPDAPAKLQLTATDKTITATWETVNRADGYKVEYKESAAADWTACDKTTETTYTVEGLKFETAYDVRVIALVGEVASEPSEAAQITTLAEIKQLETPQNVTAEADYGVATLTFDPVVGAADYEVYANGSTEKLVGMITSAAEAEKVTYKVTGLAFNTAYTFQVKAVAEGVTASELSTATESATTSEIVQVKNNVGPTTATVAWRKNLGKYEEAVAKPYDQYTIQIADKDGKIMGAVDLKSTNYGAAASTLGKHEQGNLNPSRFTFGALTPATTYKVRVKKLGEDDLLYSPWCEITTEAAHVKAAKEVLYEGFDEAWYGGDVMNLAGAMRPTGDNPKAPVMTWESYIGNTDTSRVADETGSTASTLSGALCKLESSSLYGWEVVQSMALRSGYAKFGGSKKPGIVHTKVLGDEVLNATTATPCTITFKAAPYSEWSEKDGKVTDTSCEAKISIIVVHADGTETVAIENFDPITNGKPFDYVWKAGSVNKVMLLSTDKLKITSENTGTNSCRFMFDDLHVVAE